MSQAKVAHSNHQLIFISSWALLLSISLALPWTDPPLIPGQHFMFMWNAPTELCEIRFGMPLDLSFFSLVSSTLKTATNQSISIFYSNRFGVFPYVDEDTGTMYDDGLPQLMDFQEHRELAEDDIEYYIPIDKPGLAVLDFEEWRPQWVRNWGSKDIYRQISIETVKKKNVSLTDEQAEDLARVSFERAAKKYFIRSIRIGKRLRPQRLWGYYLYPDCYNYDYNQDLKGYTGECPEIEHTRNDELVWLWKESTALYPSIYLELVIGDSMQARMYVRHRIHETIRISSIANSSIATPTYAFIRPVYKDSVDDYLSEFDLVNTIGEAAALGAAGVISWGDMNVTDTEDSCLDARRHLEQIMNPYILNVSTATRLCSEALCQGKGRCVRKHWNQDVFLHLHPSRYKIQQQQGGKLTVTGGLSFDDVNWFDHHFDCMCYSSEKCRSLRTFNVIEELIVTTTDGCNPSKNTLLLVGTLFCVWFGATGM